MGHLLGPWQGLSCLLGAALGAPQGSAGKPLASEGHALRNGVSVIARIRSVWRRKSLQLPEQLAGAHFSCHAPHSPHPPS